MTVPFLTYELLTPETADPVVIRITGQRERGFPDFRASNGEKIVSRDLPYYGHYCHTLWTHGKMQGYDGTSVEIPLSDWPAVKQAIRELNEHYKEKDMDMKRIDEYNKMVRDIAALVEPVGYDLLVNPDATLTVTRKKPKVKVEYCLHEGYKSTQYGQYHIVQFRVTGEVAETYVKLHPTCGEIDLARKTEFRDNPCKTGYSRITIGVDAREKWSAPVLLPESTYSRLDEITKALEDRANEVKE